MKAHFTNISLNFVIALSTFALNAPSQAATVSARIDALGCSGWNIVQGTTTIAFAGNLGGQSYLNISNMNPMGLPFTQQALIERVRLTGNKSLVFTLAPMITGGKLYLELFDGSTRGVLTGSPGDDRNGIELLCHSRIN